MPPTITDMVTLVGLDLGGNTKVSGTIPENIGDLKFMIGFSLSGTSVSGTIPNSITNWNLVEAILFNNNVHLNGSNIHFLILSLCYLFCYTLFCVLCYLVSGH